MTWHAARMRCRADQRTEADELSLPTLRGWCGTEPRRSCSGHCFSHKELVADRRRGYVDQRITGHGDLSTLERCYGSYVSPDPRELCNDMVWRVRSSTQGLDLRPCAHRVPVAGGSLHGGAHARLCGRIAPAFPVMSHLQPAFTYLFLDENRIPPMHAMRLHHVASAIFALEQSQDAAARTTSIEELRSWRKNRLDLHEALGTRYAACVVPQVLRKSPHTIRIRIRIPIAEVEPMRATRIHEEMDGKIALAAEVAVHAVVGMVMKHAVDIAV
jgi:hypothetical protein